MASTRAVDDGNGVDLLGSAAALRWSRPDLTGAIADHVLEIADANADTGCWLRAAGWAVSARSATGDGRTVASDVLDGVVRRGVHVLDEPAADRLRVELAVLATGAGRLATARMLLTPVSVADTGAELRADALGALARCAVEDRPTAVDGLLRRVESAWAEIGGPSGHIGMAAACLVGAAAERRAGRPDSAVAKAAGGLAHLDGSREGRSQSPSRHLAAGLAAEWISGLLDSGRTDEARDGSGPLDARLRDTSHPSRQLALLRLAVARTVTGSGADAVVEALTRAARDAGASDAPDLEAVCLSALGALQEKAGQIEQGLESIRLGVAAQRRDQQRAERFRTALDAAVPSVADAAPERAVAAEQARVSGGGRARVTGHHRSEGSAPRAEPSVARSAGPWTDWGTAVARDRTSTAPAFPGAANGSARSDDPAHPLATRADPGTPSNGTRSGDAGGNGRPSGRNGPASNGTGIDGGGAPGWDATLTDPQGISPWRGWTDDSPIGHLLAQSLRSGGPTSGEGTRPDEHRSGRREERRSPDAVADPWSTGHWSMGHGATPERTAGDPPDIASGRAGRRRRADPVDDAAATAVPEVPSGSRLSRWYERPEPGPADDPAGWLQNALAELDRVWGTTTGTAAAAGKRSGPAPEVGGCVVVIDLARDGRRFAGRRAGAVVRALADRLGDRLPSGARVRHDDADALSVVLPGWSRSPATEWMHRTLPGLFEDFVTDEDLPGTQLRAAVHDADGPVGAQLLQRLDRPQRRPARDALGTGPLWGSPSPEAVAPATPPADAGRRRRRDAEEPPVAAATSQDVRRDAPPTGDRAGEPGSTDGLGLADLLAGALAAYRGI